MGSPIVPKPFLALLKHEKINVVDVGAAGGLQSRWKALLPYVNAFLFEPDKRSYERMLQKNDGISYVNCALGGQCGTVELNLTRKPQCSSVYLPNREFIEQFPEEGRFDVTGKLEIELTTLSRLREANLLPRIDFIKIDVEGYEYEILSGGDYHISQEAFGLEVEVEFQSIRREQPLFCDVHKFLSEKGYDLYDLRFTYWKRRGPIQTRQAKGQIIFADAVYFKKVSFLTEVIRRSEKIMARRITVHAATLFAIYGYYDCSRELIAARDDLFSEDEKSEILAFFRPSWWARRFTSHKIHNALVYLADIVDPARRGYFKVWPMIGNLRDGGGATDSKAQGALVSREVSSVGPD